MHDVTQDQDPTQSANELASVFGRHGEWLYTEPRRETTRSLRRGEIEVSAERNRVWLSCFGEFGAEHWRVRHWDWNGEKLTVQAERRAGAVRVKLLFLPRATAAAALAIIAAERMKRCLKLAELVAERMPGWKVERATLSPGTGAGQPGRYARIVLNDKGRQRIAITGSVTEGGEGAPDALLVSAILWHARLRDRVAKPPFTGLGIVGSAAVCDYLQRRTCLLNEALRRELSLFVLDEEWTSTTPRPELKSDVLWSKAPPSIRRPRSPEVSRTAAAIMEQAPDAIDVVHGGRGETIRYHGLPFARVRRLMGEEHAWFGIERLKRRSATADSFADLATLIDDLRTHRTALTADRAHAMYRLAPESWLESMLRRDITQLDPGLRLAPLYAQFRAPHDPPGVPRPVDLLALRQDGRLAVIELKVAPDREHVFQGLDYWTRIELHRRWGTITRARLFDDAEIADYPPLVYLVAPMLSFHRNFNELARAVSPEIEIYRFDLNEDWRAGIRVTRRVGVNAAA
jgi:hypothetical protein